MLLLLIIIKHVIVSLEASYPNCSDATTYKSYGKSTQYKGLTENIAWDRTRNTSDSCDFSGSVAIDQPLSCGDCDFELDGDVWYHFDEGPYAEIKEYHDKNECPPRGHCNGQYQIALLESDVESGNDRSKLYYVIASDSTSNQTCFVIDDETQMVEEYYCDGFVLYKFPSDWSNSKGACKREVGESRYYPVPFSFCMYDEVTESLTFNRKYVMAGEDLTLTCQSVRKPKPPKLSWINQDGVDLTSLATRTNKITSLFNITHSFNSTRNFTSITCGFDQLSHTFYKITSIQTTNPVKMKNQQSVNAHCYIRWDKTENLADEDVYFVYTSANQEVYYTLTNITDRANTLITYSSSHGYILALSELTSTTESWKCGVCDPETGEYFLESFQVTESPCNYGEGDVGSGECEVCGKGKYSSEGRCVGCPEGMMSSPGCTRCVGILAGDIVSRDKTSLVTSFSVETGSFTDELKENLYLIRVGEGGSKEYFTVTNFTNSEGEMVVTEVGGGTYNVSLVRSETNVPDNVRSVVESWEGGIRDYLTGSYTTLPFTITLNKYCTSGTGYTDNDATVCTKCPRNTYSDNNTCKACPSGQRSQEGWDTCVDVDSKGAAYYVLAGSAGALALILVLMISAICWTRRRRHPDVVMANPNVENNRQATSKTAAL